MVFAKGKLELLYESATRSVSSNLRWSVRIWYLNHSVASSGRMFSNAIFSLENSLGLEDVRKGMVGAGPLHFFLRRWRVVISSSVVWMRRWHPLICWGLEL